MRFQQPHVLYDTRVKIMADEKLIEAVRSFPCLCQVSSASYKDARARENAWKKVASQVTE